MSDLVNIPFDDDMVSQARGLLGAASAAGLDSSVVQTTRNGFRVPQEVLDDYLEVLFGEKAKTEEDKTEEAKTEEAKTEEVETEEAKTEEVEEPKTEESKPKPAKKAPAKKTAAKKTASSKSKPSLDDVLGEI